MKKTTLSNCRALRLLATALLLLAVSVAANAYSFSAVNDDGVTIYYNKSGSNATVTYKSTSYNSYSGNVVIPETVTYNGTTYSVTGIGDNAFYKCTGLTSVTIPNSVTEIGDDAFRSCTGLTGELIIPNSVTSIGSYAFSSCSGLTGELIIPNSVTTIDEWTFSGCTGLTEVAIPESVTSIGNEAFRNCSGLTSVTIGGGAIGKCAFEDCTSLTSVTIGNSVETIGDYAFRDCYGLTEVKFNATSCTSAGSSESTRVFYNCDNISTVTIGEEVAILPDYLFYNNTRIKEVDFNATACTSAGSSSSKRAFYGCAFISTLNFGDNVTIIPDYLCYDCTRLANLTIPNSVTEIGERAFQSCTGLTSVTIGNNVETIGSHAFSGCTGLTQVTIPESVTTIGSYAFSSCSGMTGELIIPNSVTTIDEGTFSGCTGLTEVAIPESVTSIGNEAFRNCSGLTSVTIGENVTKIGGYAFYKCSGLTEVKFNAIACTSAGSSSYRAFYGCDNISTVNFGDNVTIIPDYLFYYCTGLTSVTIGNSVTSIGNYAFYHCTGLTEITIPNSVTTIGTYAFYYCSGLTEVTSLATTHPTITKSTFEENVIEYLEVPIGALIDYASAEYWSNISKIYAVSDGSEYYPVIISREGDAIVTASGGDENGAEVKAGATATIKPMGSGQINGYVQHGVADITETLNSKGSYSFTVSQYHKENTIHSYAISASNTFDLTVPQAGDVLNQVTVANINSVYSLKVTGDINGTDILTIRRMPNLQVLDLSDANVVSGGDYYYDNSYSTSDDCVGDYFFYDMTSLMVVKLPNSAASIGEYALSGCTGLTGISIPDNVVTIGDHAFSGCTELVDVTIGNSVTTIGEYAFCDCSSLTSVTIGNSVTSIGSDAFQNCSRLPSINIPGSVVEMSWIAFYGCNNLKTVSFEDGEETLTIPSVSRGVYTNPSFPSLESLYLGRNISYKNNKNSYTNYGYYSPFAQVTTLKSVTIGEKTQSLHDYLFYGCSGLTYLTIPNSVTEIGDYAFYECTGLPSVAIPNGVETIGEDAFYYCTGLTSLTIGNSVTTICSGAFAYCSGLTQITIPSCVRTIYWNSFYACESLKSLTFEDGESTLEIANNITTPAYSSFKYCETLYLGRNLRYSNTSNSNSGYYSPFAQLTALKSVTIRNSVSTIPDYLFYKSTSITSLVIGNQVTSIGSSAFYNCTGLTEVKTPNRIEEIGDNAFYGCSAMTTLTIGNGCTSIGSNAFYKCSNLMTVYSKAVTPPDISSNTFSGVDKTACTLYVPNDGLNSYWLHVYWSEFYNMYSTNFDDSDDTDPVGRVTADAEAEIVGYYTTDGKKISQLQRGINIVRYGDGSTRKVMVK